MDEFARSVDGCAQIGVLHCARFDQVDRAAQGVAQCFRKVEVLPERGPAVSAPEFHQKISIAVQRIKVRAMRRRAENFEPHHVLAPAELCRFFPFFRDDSMHGRPSRCSEGCQLSTFC